MKKKVIAYLHTHWDREWYESKEEFNLRLLDVFDEVLDELSLNRAPSFYFDGQISALEDYLNFRPEKKSLIKKFIKEILWTFQRWGKKKTFSLFFFPF